MKILINDGLHQKGIWLLEEAGFEVDDITIPQEVLSERLPEYDAIIIRSATRLTSELLEASPSVRLIGRGGVGLDNIDMEFALSHGIEVINTPAASSRSVAELVFGHVISIARGLNQTNRVMPVVGNTEFKQLKKRFSRGVELCGKTLGIIGLGRIGTEVARIGLGMGMKVVAFDPKVEEKKISIEINGQQVYTTIHTINLNELLAQSDVITMHVPHQKEPLIGIVEIEKMREGAILVNASRGGILDEEALLTGLNSGKFLGVGLDVFDGEPSPRQDLLSHPLVSLSPHIGASTDDAQEKIGVELARSIIGWYEQNSIHEKI